MARIRSVKPDLFASSTLKSVSIEARYLYVGLFTEADDEGRLIDSPKRLAGVLFPHDESVDSTTVDTWLGELERARDPEDPADKGCVERYAAGTGRYLCLPKWTKHQRVPHPSESKIPAPPWALRSVSDEDHDGSRDPREVLAPELEFDLGSGTPKSPTALGTTPVPITKRANPRTLGTNPRAIGATVSAQAARDSQLAGARSLGRCRASIDDHDEILAELGEAFPDDEAAIDAGYTAWLETQQAEEAM